MKISELEELIRKTGAPTNWEKFLHFFGKCSFKYELEVKEEWCAYKYGYEITNYTRSVQNGFCKICGKIKKRYLS